MEGTYIVRLGLPLGHLVLVQGEAGGDPAEPDISQHILVICHAALASSGTYRITSENTDFNFPSHQPQTTKQQAELPMLVLVGRSR